jgi:hypothetical protein
MRGEISVRCSREGKTRGMNREDVLQLRDLSIRKKGQDGLLRKERRQRTLVKVLPLLL